MTNKNKQAFVQNCKPEIISGFYHSMKGFTLIELLVVVLIIGILAAVAFPQYQKAVVKSRFAEAFTNLKTLSQAYQACQLSKGKAGDCRIYQGELDVDVPENNNFFYETMLIDGVVAQYKKEDVCLCLYNSGKLVVDQTGESYCLSKTASMDYAKLLNLPDKAELDEDEEGADCTCC